MKQPRESSRCLVLETGAASIKACFRSTEWLQYFTHWYAALRWLRHASRIDYATWLMHVWYNRYWTTQASLNTSLYLFNLLLLLGRLSHFRNKVDVELQFSKLFSRRRRERYDAVVLTPMPWHCECTLCSREKTASVQVIENL